MRRQAFVLLIVLVSLFFVPRAQASYPIEYWDGNKSYRASMIVVFHDYASYDTGGYDDVSRLINETGVPVALAFNHIETGGSWYYYHENKVQGFLAAQSGMVEFINHSLYHMDNYTHSKTFDNELYGWVQWDSKHYELTGRKTRGYMGPYFGDPSDAAMDYMLDPSYEYASPLYVIGYGGDGLVRLAYNNRIVKFPAHTLSFDDWTLDQLKSEFLSQRSKGWAMVTMAHSLEKPAKDVSRSPKQLIRLVAQPLDFLAILSEDGSFLGV